MFASIAVFKQKSATGNVMERGMYKMSFSKWWLQFDKILVEYFKIMPLLQENSN